MINEVGGRGVALAETQPSAVRVQRVYFYYVVGTLSGYKIIFQGAI